MQPINRTSVELKHLTLRVYLVVINYQSYQCGIETSDGCFSQLLSKTINRTSVELKLKTMKITISNIMTINRTSVELKHKKI